MKYSSILLIYNPKATSSRAAKRAATLAKALEKAGLTAERVPTKHAGHAEELAYKRASDDDSPLIVSVSGDGGYNEVVNGVMRAIDEGKAGSPICAVYAAGNANDHGATVHTTRLAEAIINHKVEHINLLHMQTKADGKTFERYAHAYVGFDFSGQLGQVIDDYHGSRLVQTRAALKGLRDIEPVRIIFDNGREHLIDVFVCANVNRMARYLKLSKQNDLHDGHFNLVMLEHGPKPGLLRQFAKMILGNFDRPKLLERVDFTLPQETLIQYDGEVHTLAADTHVTVQSLQDRLATIR